MRIGLYGGSFDPPHRGHLTVAVAAAEAFSLHFVSLAPTGRQPLKDGTAHASYADRFAMVELLCEEAPGILHASALDAPHQDGSANYTIDLLRKMQRDDAEIFHIVGADSFLQIRQWRASEELFQLAHWIVVSRPGFSLDDLSPLHLTEEERTRVHLLQTVHVDISATRVRQRLADGERCDDALTPGVADYIAMHGLYKD